MPDPYREGVHVPLTLVPPHLLVEFGAHTCWYLRFNCLGGQRLGPVYPAALGAPSPSVSVHHLHAPAMFPELGHPGASDSKCIAAGLIVEKHG